jgi:hypothetical protein
MHARRRTLIAAAALATATLVVGGCAKHFRYIDVGTDNEYYAKGGKVNRRAGTVTFTDAETGRRVTLQAYERERISKREFREETMDIDDM